MSNPTRLFILPFLIMLSGCVSMQTDGVSVGDTAAVMRADLTKINDVKVGMTADEVNAIMGDQIVVGYVIEEQGGQPSPVYLDQPQKQDTVIKDGKTYDIRYFYTHIHKADGMIAEDELTPLVFEAGILVAKSRDYVYRLKNEP